MKRVLILEDNDTYVELLRDHLHTLSLEQDEDIIVENIQTQVEVEESVNNRPPTYYDAILLDYYAAVGSFHALDIEHFGADKVVAISSVESKNQQAHARGVQRSVAKNPNRQGTATAAMIKHVKEIIFGNSTTTDHAS